MGSPKQDKEAILRKRRLAARKRQERIKNDPVLHQQQKENNKERYNRRKQEKKILPISEMTAKEKKKMQKRNRENFRAYYKRKKYKQLETISDEVQIDVEEPDCLKHDPLHFTSPSVSTHSSYALRSKASQRNTRDKSSLQHEVKTDLIDQDFTQKTSNCNSRETSPVQHKVTPDFFDHYLPQITSNDSTFTNEVSQSYCTMSLTPRLSRALSASSDTCVITEQNQSEHKADHTVQDSSSCATPSSHSSVCSRRYVEKPKRLINSPSLVFKRYKYKVNKEMAQLRRKIEKLKKEKCKFRNQALRLKKLIQEEKKAEQKKISSNNDSQTIKEED